MLSGVIVFFSPRPTEQQQGRGGGSYVCSLRWTRAAPRSTAASRWPAAWRRPRPRGSHLTLAAAAPCPRLTPDRSEVGVGRGQRAEGVSSKLLFPQLIKDWEVIDDLQAEMHPGGESPHDMTTPGICEGYLLKRRKWPLKGWHKVRHPSVHPPPPSD